MLLPRSIPGRFIRDLYVAWRGLTQARGFACAAVACLALALALVCGVTAAGVGVLHPVVPYPSPSRLVQLGETGVFPVVSDGDVDESPRITRAVLDDVRGQHVFSQVGEYEFTTVGLEGDDQPTRGAYALSSQMLPLLGVPPALGRWFTPDEDRRGQGNVVMLSHAFWLARFGGDSSALGEVINLVAGRSVIPHVIIGVLPAWFSFPAGYTPDFYLPFGSDVVRPFPSPKVIARLAPNVGIGEAEVVLQTIVERHAAADRAAARAAIERYRPATHGQVDIAAPTGPVRATVRVYTHEIEGSATVRQAAVLILIATGCVLLLAAVNVSNLLLARGHARRVEIGTRLALGASRWAVVRLLLAESALLAVAGAVLGVATGFATSRYLLPAGSTGALRLVMDGRTLGATFACALVLIAACGLIPALRVSEFRLDDVMRGGRRAAFGARRLESISSRLLVLSTAVTMALMVATGLIATGIVRALREMRAGNWDDVAALQVSVGDDVRSGEFLRRAARMPGVRDAAYGKPPSSVRLASAVVDVGGGGPLPLGYADVSFVSPDYFSVLEIPLIAGRTFGELDGGGPPPLIIDERTAARLWPGASAVGQRLRLRLNGDSIATEYAVAAVASSRRLLLNTSNRQRSAAFYFPRRASANPGTWVLLRTTDGLDGDLNRLLRRAARDIGGGIRTGRFVSVAALQAQRSVLARVIGTTFGAFAVVSLLLVALGLYALISFAVERRRHELGVRLAVGATGARIVRMLVGSTLGIAAIGVGLGALGSLLIVPVLRSRLSGLPTSAPLVYVTAGTFILFASALATWAGARRATKYEPIAILRVQ